jgi:hypothetical protein
MNMMRLMRALQGSLICLTLGTASGSFAQGPVFPTPTNITIPVVTIQATDPLATWSGNPGMFTVFRRGNLAPSLNIYYQISGSAINGRDYQLIPNWVQIPSGVVSSDIVINPTNQGQTAIGTVTLTLTNSPLMMPGIPINYVIGNPSSDTVYITPGPVTNIPSVADIVYPLDGAVFYAPVSIPIVAGARDVDGWVTSVEFFADNVSLGVVTNPVSILPPMYGPVLPLPPMPPYRPFVLVWSNAPTGLHALTAKATDNSGASSFSDPVNITVNPGPPPPPTNFPPVVRITSPPNNSVFRQPLNLPIYAYAADRDGFVTNMEFFAGTNDLGPGHRVSAVPPPLPPGPIQPPILIVVPTNYWTLVWTNPQQGTYPLTAVAADNYGASIVSDAVNATILPEVPPPVVTNLVGIVATDPIAIEGTNCWPWLGLAAATPTWANWTASTAVCRYFTNCGPKDATFTVRRLGSTNNDLTVSYATGGTATNGVDYVTLPGTVTIPAGQRAALITVVPLDDGRPDITSTVILKLTPSANYVTDPRHSVAAAIILDRRSRPPVATVLPDRCFRISSAGPDGAWFHIEYTTDLRNWTGICTNQVFAGSLDFIDPDAQQSELRFYRAVPEADAP